LAFCLHVSARSNAQQRIAINVKNVSLQRLFSDIEKKTNYTFFYDVTILKGTRPVTVVFKDATVEEVLKAALAGQALEYTVNDKTIFVKRERKAVAEAGPVDTGGAAAMRLRGVVLTDAGVPVQGANVTIKQTEHGTITNAKGEFELSGVAPGSTLIFSYVGYAPQSFEVKDGSQIRVFMKVAQNELDKAVVQAYGLTTQRLTTADIGKVTAEEIERQPVMNPLLALEGKVAGLDINMTNGYASAPIRVELRGRATISGSFPADPLYIIDGVPLTVLDPGNISSYQTGSTGFDQTGYSPASGQSPFFSINPNDIESIEVLKDADATAIYGSRGANGVILISTKKGKAGRTVFNIRANEGVNFVTRHFDLMDSREYVAMRREALLNDGLTADPIGDYDVNGTWDTTKSINWQKVLYGNSGRMTDVQATISGGDSRTTFRMSVDFDKTTDITTINGANQRIAVLLSLTHRSLDQRLTIASNSTYSYASSNMSHLAGASTIAPDAPAIFDSLGNLNYSGWGGTINNTQARNAYPFASLRQPYTAGTNFLNSSLNLSYQFIKGLAFSTNVGYNIARADQTIVGPIAAGDPLINPTGFLILGYNSNSNWIVEPKITYDNHIGKGLLNFLIGASASETHTEGTSITGFGFTSDTYIHNIGFAPNVAANSNTGEYRYAGIFARLTYNLSSRYVINLNARRDGSSRFGPGKQFGDFGSVGAAWIMSDEPWLNGRIPSWISFIKWRGSYGLTGSDVIGDYGYLSRYMPYSVTYNGTITLRPIQAPNPDYQWQINKKLEAALDLGFLHDRATFQVAWYRDRCGNQLINFPTPLLTGFASTDANSPALVQNVGWEVSIAAKIIEYRKFSWSATFNTAINQNKLVAYPNFSKSPYVGQLKIGEPLNMLYKLQYIGVDPITGQFSFLDRNHDGQIIFAPGHPEQGDDSYILNLTPKFFGGLGMNFNYGFIQLSLFFNIKSQLGINFLGIGNTPGTRNNNQPAGLANKEWKRPGDISDVARYTTQGGNDYDLYYGLSNGPYSDASFVRLSNLAISMNLSGSRIKKMGMQSCSLLISTNNLFTITRYQGVDPETQNFNGLPPTRTVAAGLNFTF